MLQHDAIYLVDCVYMDIQGNTVYVQVPLGSESKGVAAIPGSPDRTAALHKRLTKTEREILSLKTRISCERASWERRFAELQKKQEELRNQLMNVPRSPQLTSEAGGLMKVDRYDDQGELGVDNGEVFEECSSGLSRLACQQRTCRVSSREDPYASSLSGQLSSSSALSSRPGSSTSSATSVRSWKMSPGHHRVFVPHSPMDLQLGHRVRIMLPSGRISTGTIRFLGHLQGEADLHLGVELQTADHGLHDGSYKGHIYFKCKPGYGAFVPFHKLLMAWE
ncbi:CAP-Gly domain-containing linker protein 4 [Anabas testudineus]|uniref:CAP-Gly domain-containing linker protein 4 n=1 Tax=Anabas testudineus TaxID=64144 RepID=UPI000E466198|nr:CAP-Gly domain-containing linker protein 4 [Anabas testudineus]